MILNSGRHTRPDPQSCRVRSLGGRRGEPKNKQHIKRQNITEQCTYKHRKSIPPAISQRNLFFPLRFGRCMEIHRFVPSHRTGCVEMMVNSSMNSRGNGRLTLSRFVLDKSHPRMRHDMWISTFSGSLHSA